MDYSIFSKSLIRLQKRGSSSLTLNQGSRVAVIGGGPAGGFFSYFLLDMAERIGIKLHVDIYEPRNFNLSAPLGCNMCGGVIYESLVQSLAVEGINLPTTVVQRGIEFNKLHMDDGSVQIQTPRHEKRIATTYRGNGPRGLREFKGKSLDGFLLETAVAKGARHIRARVEEVRWAPDSKGIASKALVQIRTPGSDFQTYELVAVTSGVNTSLLRHFQNMDFGYQPPETTKLLAREYYLGEQAVSKYVGSVFHAFLLNIPGLDYGAIIPKGDHITVCLLSSKGDLEPRMMEVFLNEPVVKKALPPDFSPARVACGCGPRINTGGSAQPFGDRIVFVGDSGVSRLYKDGIGAAYRSAKIAAGTAILQGIAAEDFARYYLPFCRKMEFDNQIGRLHFKVIELIQKSAITRRAVLRMVTSEQRGKANAQRGMSMLMWDMLTGGTPYKEVLIRALHPWFLVRFLWNIFVALLPSRNHQQDSDFFRSTSSGDDRASTSVEENTMELGALGKTYQAGQNIIRQGEMGDCMYVIQEGLVEVVKEMDGRTVQLAVLGKDQFFGEMAIFEQEARAATVRALTPVRIITIDQKNLLRRIQEDPSLAYRLVQVMSSRVRKLGEEFTLSRGISFSMSPNSMR